jgi:hypothetical protein
MAMIVRIIDLLGKTIKMWKKFIFLEIIFGVIFILGMLWYVRDIY